MRNSGLVATRATLRYMKSVVSTIRKPLSTMSHQLPHHRPRKEEFLPPLATTNGVVKGLICLKRRCHRIVNKPYKGILRCLLPFC